jgi:alkylhydroperoxidase/carboxymuconolactone decarboxylase family protein YurZ
MKPAPPAIGVPTALTAFGGPMSIFAGPERRKRMASTGDTPVLDLLGTMTAASIEASELDARSLMLVRIAALVAVDAPPVSYLMNLNAAASGSDVSADDVRGVLAAVAPIVGTSRVASATEKIVQALAVEIEVAALEAE